MGMSRLPHPLHRLLLLPALVTSSVSSSLEPKIFMIGSSASATMNRQRDELIKYLNVFSKHQDALVLCTNAAAAAAATAVRISWRAVIASISLVFNRLIGVVRP